MLSPALYAATFSLNVTAGIISQIQNVIDNVSITVSVDDTPIDGHTAIPVSSNALFDHDAAGLIYV